ncbi:Hypothetical predicted protein [Lecanosticta acicola]|uniref:Uncharacterized protein n=1 Tax=Lecanosticta acicola TaxID=111012 RepID=A0AAI8Z929_9PEZI|nr:Hypothetical predicted protein [Lecanosticta acicola]
MTLGGPATNFGGDIISTISAGAVTNGASPSYGMRRDLTLPIAPAVITLPNESTLTAQVGSPLSVGSQSRAPSAFPATLSGETLIFAPDGVMTNGKTVLYDDTNTLSQSTAAAVLALTNGQATIVAPDALLIPNGRKKPQLVDLRTKRMVSRSLQPLTA